MGYGLEDGRQEWTVPVPLPITSLFAASSGCVVVGGRGGHCLAVRPENGRTIYEGRIPFAPSGIYAGHDQSETLYLIGLGAEADGHEVQLAAVDLAKRRVLWTRTDLSVPVCGQWSLEALADRIALVYASPEQSRAKAPSFLNVQSTALVLLDKRTGELAAEPLPLAIENGLTTPAGEIQFWPNRVVIGTTGGVNILPLELQRVRSSPSG